MLQFVRAIVMRRLVARLGALKLQGILFRVKAKQVRSGDDDDGGGGDEDSFDVVVVVIMIIMMMMLMMMMMMTRLPDRSCAA
jgi:hypothetical protein